MEKSPREILGRKIQKRKRNTYQKVRVKTRRVRKACQQDRFRAAHLSLLKTSVRACVRKVRTSVGGHVRGGGQEGRGIKYELPLFAQASLLPSCGSRAP